MPTPTSSSTSGPSPTPGASSTSGSSPSASPTPTGGQQPPDGALDVSDLPTGAPPRLTYVHEDTV
ncbi:hypothetical protein, partial [Nocardioides sp.]|uniref:hypothetical protein n=1 Tax=Nocardioides sp. TaxID=35761 RepID=UPI003566BFB8